MSSPVLFQALPPLSPEEYSELERSILDNGVMVPIVIDENNGVIDGDNAYLDEDAEFWEHHPNNEPELAPEPEPVAPQPEPEPAPKPRRRPLEAGFFDAVERLRKATISLQNLGNDDRLPRNKENVRRYRGDVLRAIDALQCVAEQLN